MDILIFAQTFFYFVVSFAIIALSILFALVVYHLVYIAKNLHSISDDISHVSRETEERLEEIIDGLSRIPILSFFLKKRHTRNHRTKK